MYLIRLSKSVSPKRTIMDFFSSIYIWIIPLTACLITGFISLIIRIWYNRLLQSRKSEETKVIKNKDLELEIDDWVSKIRKKLLED